MNTAEVQTEPLSSSQETDKLPTDGVTEGTVLQTVEEVDYHPDCPVCLQSCFYPVKLPCGHIFCFLCIKGVVLRSRKCALCRHSVTVDYLENPTLIKVVDKDNKESKASKADVKHVEDDDPQEFGWYYEGRNGWWAYDEKTSTEVEKAFKNGQRTCILLIAGFLYVIDFENMFQTRKNEPGRRRRIKRDKRDVESKGVAGIRIPTSTRSTAPSQAADSSSSDKRDNVEKQTGVERSSTEVPADTVQSQLTATSEENTGVEQIATSSSVEQPGLATNQDEWYKSHTEK